MEDKRFRKLFENQASEQNEFLTVKVKLDADGPIDVDVVFSCINTYYKPKVICNIYTLINKVTSGISTSEIEEAP